MLVLLAALALVGGAAPATAGVPTECVRSPHPEDGVYPPVVVEGDMVVLGSCSQHNTTVTGDVHIRPGGWWSAQDVTVGGDVVVGGRLRMHDSTVGGDARLATGEPVEISSTSVAGGVSGSGGQVQLFWSSIAGGLDVTATERTYVYDSTVAGATATRGGRFNAWGSRFGGDVVVDGPARAQVCRSSFAGDLTVRGSRWLVDVGIAPEAAGSCLSPTGGPTTHVAGSLILIDNPHSITVGHATVDGDLLCERNTGPRLVTVLDDVMVGGTRTGQCV